MTSHAGDGLETDSNTSEFDVETFENIAITAEGFRRNNPENAWEYEAVAVGVKSMTACLRRQIRHTSVALMENLCIYDT